MGSERFRDLQSLLSTIVVEHNRALKKHTIISIGAFCNIGGNKTVDYYLKKTRNCFCGKKPAIFESVLLMPGLHLDLYLVKILTKQAAITRKDTLSHD